MRMSWKIGRPERTDIGQNDLVEVGDSCVAAVGKQGARRQAAARGVLPQAPCVSRQFVKVGRDADRRVIEESNFAVRVRHHPEPAKHSGNDSPPRIVA